MSELNKQVSKVADHFASYGEANAHATLTFMTRYRAWPTLARTNPHIVSFQSGLSDFDKFP